MKRTPFIATLLAAAVLTVGLFATHSALAGKGGGGKPQDDPPPPVLYKIDRLGTGPIGRGTDSFVSDINNSGVLVGHFWNAQYDEYPFIIFPMDVETFV